MHKIICTLEVEEHDDETEQEICLKIQKIFVESCGLLDYAANNFATTTIEKGGEE